MFWLLIFLLQLSHCSSTCVIALKYENGIILGSDSQSSTNNFIGHREAKKIRKLNSKTILCCASGEEGFERLCQQFEKEILELSNVDDSNGLILSTLNIANYCRKLIHSSYRQTHIIVAGFDNPLPSNIPFSSVASNMLSKNPSLKLPFLYEIIAGGTLIEQDIIIAGSVSGSLYPLANELYSSALLNGSPSVPDPSTPQNQQSQIINQPSFINNLQSSVDSHDNTAASNDPLFKKSEKIASTNHIKLSMGIEIINKLLNNARTLDPKSGGQSKIYVFETC
jgi:20S proteasome subunit beta 1